MILQNMRIVTEHLDLPSGRYHDTWQLVLPGWLSAWLLHYDHHLEHHLRPGLHWHELPDYRERLMARDPELGLARVTLGSYCRDVLLKRPRALAPPLTSVQSSASATYQAQTAMQSQPHRALLRQDAPAIGQIKVEPRDQGTTGWTRCGGRQWPSSWSCTRPWPTPWYPFPT